MAVIEIEVWTHEMDADYARLLTELDDEMAGDLYEYLHKKAIEWCDENGVSPKLYRRTTGRPVRLAKVLQWYTEEELLETDEMGGKTAYLPVEPVEEELNRQSQPNSLVAIDE